MSDNQARPYQPYAPANQTGCNDIVENRGQGATDPYIPNGWEGGIDKPTKEGGQ